MNIGSLEKGQHIRATTDGVFAVDYDLIVDRVLRARETTLAFVTFAHDGSMGILHTRGNGAVCLAREGSRWPTIASVETVIVADDLEDEEAA